MVEELEFRNPQLFLDLKSRYWKKEGNPEKDGHYEGEIKDGKPEGLAELFHDNGQLAGRRNWKNGELEGLWETFDETGQLTESGRYKNGVLQ